MENYLCNFLGIVGLNYNFLISFGLFLVSIGGIIFLKQRRKYFVLGIGVSLLFFVIVAIARSVFFTACLVN